MVLILPQYFKPAEILERQRSVSTSLFSSPLREKIVSKLYHTYISIPLTTPFISVHATSIGNLYIRNSLRDILIYRAFSL
jgi:hypothetical protein